MKYLLFITLLLIEAISSQGATLNGVLYDSSTKAIQPTNIVLNASQLTSGTVPSARVSGSYSGITGVGTLASGAIPAALITGQITATQMAERSVATVADMVALNPALYSYIRVASYSSTFTNGGGGAFTTVIDGGETVDNGTIWRSTVNTNYLHKRIFSGPVELSWFGPMADGVTDDRTVLLAAIAAAKASRAKALRGVDGTVYATGSRINISGLRMLRGNYLGDGTDYFFTATGSAGSYFNLGASVTAGGNSIACSGLVGSLAIGDLVKIISNADFSVGNPGDAQGEIKQVESISGTNIFFTDALFDSYTTGNTARAAKVTPTYVEFDADLVVKQTGSSSSYGILVQYANHPQIKGTWRNCAATAIDVRDCWYPDVEVNVDDAWYSGTGTSYGVIVSNASMYALIHGSVITSARHAVAFGAAGGGGVSWGGRVIGVTGSQHRSQSGGPGIFEAHPCTGSVRYINCTAIGTATGQVGFSLFALDSSVENCQTVNVKYSVYFTGNPGPIRNYKIDGIKALQCESGANGILISDSLVTNVTVNNIEIDSTGAAVKVQHAAGTITKWQFSNLKNLSGPIFSTDAADAGVPTQIVINGGYSAGGSSLLLQDTVVKDVTVNGVTATSIGAFVLNSQPRLRISVNNSSVYGATGPLIQSSGATVGTISLNGCSYIDPTASGNQYMIFATSGVVTNVHAVGNLAIGSNISTVFRFATGTPNIYSSANSFPQASIVTGSSKIVSALNSGNVPTLNGLTISSLADLPVRTTSGGIVTNGATVLSGSEVSGILTSDKGGTGYGGVATNGTVLVGNGTLWTPAANTDLFVDITNHRLGIGTITPASSLELYGTGSHFKQSYDGSHSTTIDTDATGSVTINPTANKVVLGSGNVLIQLGGTSASFAGIKRSGSGVQIRTAADGGDGDFSAKSALFSAAGNNAIAMTGNTGGFSMGSAGHIQWTATTTGGNAASGDTYIKRLSAGIMGFADSSATSGTGGIMVSNITANGSVTASSFVHSGASFGITSDATVANTGTETTLLGTAGAGSKTLSANVFTVGQTLHGIVRGRYSSAAIAGTLRIKVKLGSTVILDTGAQTMPNASSGKLFDVDYDITCRTTGGSGTIRAQGKVLIGDVTGLVPQLLPMVETTTATIDTTATQVLDVTATWGTADSGNTVTGSVGSIQ